METFNNKEIASNEKFKIIKKDLTDVLKQASDQCLDRQAEKYMDVFKSMNQQLQDLTSQIEAIQAKKPTHNNNNLMWIWEEKHS